MQHTIPRPLEIKKEDRVRPTPGHLTLPAPKRAGGTGGGAGGPSWAGGGGGDGGDARGGPKEAPPTPPAGLILLSF